MSDPQITVLLQGGPDDQTDPRLLPPGSVVSAFNQVYDQDGSYQPRFGYQQIGGNGLTSIRRMAAFVEELVAIDPTNLWTYDPTKDIWSKKDVVPPLGVTHRPLFNTTSNFLSWNEAISTNGYRVVVWIDAVDSTAIVRAAVYSVETGAMVFGPLQISAASRATTFVQVAIIGTTALVTWVDVTAAAVAGSTISLSNVQAGFGAPATLSLGGSPLVNGTYGYTLCATGTLFIVTYETATTGSPPSGNFVSVSYNTALVQQANATNNMGAHFYQSVAIAAVAADGVDLWVAVSATGAIVDSVSEPTVWAYRCSPSTLVKSAGPIDLFAGSSLPGLAILGIDLITGHAGQAIVCWGAPAAGGAPNAKMSYQWVTTSGAIIGSVPTIQNILPASYPFYDSSLDTTFVYAYRPLANPFLSTQQIWGSYYLVNLGTSASPRSDHCATLAPRQVNRPVLIGGGSPSTWVHTPRPTVVSGTQVDVAMPIVDNTGRQGMEGFRADRGANFRWTPASLGRENYLSGDIYDGNLLSEIGFAYNPIIESITATGSGSFTGTWTYVVTYGRINAQGDLEESAPSPPVSVTATSNATFTLTVLTLGLTQKQRTTYGTAANANTPIYIIVYRTQVATAGDTNHYRLFNEPFPAQLQNSLLVASFSITDTTTDASLTDGTHPTLYTDSGELPHNCPETFTHCCVHKNRLVGIAADQRTIWDSQQYVFAVTPAFNELATTTVDDTSEPLVAVASLYDKLLIFTQTRIYVRYGDGPAISGVANDWTVPQRIVSTSGCIDPRSIVNTPMGVMFQGIMGLMLIDQGLNVSFIGRNIVNALAATPICTSAQWVEDVSSVRFTFLSIDDSTSGAGVIAHYDVRRSRWAIHQVPYNLTGTPAPLQGGAWHPQLGYCIGYSWFQPGHNAQAFTLREGTLADATPWLDAPGVFVPLTVTMAPIRANGAAQDWQRVRRVRLLENYYTPHTVEVDVGYDYGATSEAHNYTDTTITGLAVGSRAQVRITPAHGKCEAIQVVLKTTAPTVGSIGTGQGAGLTGVALEILAKKGGYKNMGASAKT